MSPTPRTWWITSKGYPPGCSTSPTRRRLGPHAADQERFGNGRETDIGEREEESTVEPRTTAMVNIGILLTGDLTGPISDADSLLIERGTITAIGGVDTSTADRTIDVGGATVGPGLIDSHCHVVLGDYTPRQNTVGFLSSYVHGGIVQAISAGEIHTPGRPTDRVGGKALAVASRHWWDGYRPNGMKVHGGSVVIEPDLTDEDFLEIAD